MKPLFSLVLALSLLTKTNFGLCARRAWPEMAEFSAKVGIETSTERIFFEFPLIDVEGQTQYRLSCVGGSQKYLDRLSDSSGNNYVGPLACLLEEEGGASDSLLSEDDSPHWYSRGQIHSFRDLAGSC